MMQGPIQRVMRHRVEQRGDERLPMAWVGGATGPADGPGGTWLLRGPIDLLPSGDDPLLVFLGDREDEARAVLLAYARSGARAYAVVGPAWGKNPADSQILQAPRVLVRRVPEVPAAAVHAGKEACVWLGGGFVLRLDDPQAEALRQTFLRQFWHEATEEAWSGGRQFEWRPARERPFDVPGVLASAPVRWDEPAARLAGEVRGALMHLTGGAPPDTAPQRLWYPAGPDHHERFAQLTRAGAEVLWSDRGLPDLQVGAGSGEVLLSGARGRLRLRLTSGQSSEVARLLQADAHWHFRTDIRLGDASHRTARFWLPSAGSALGLEAEQIIEVADVQTTSLRDVPDTAPASVPPARPLALSVRYQWSVIPPRAPAGAQEDALLGRWRKLDEDWTARLARIREVLVAAEGDRGRIGRAFSRLVSAMLGFERTQGGLMARVTELEALLPSRAGPADAPALLARLEEIEDAARRLQSELDEAERKAREEEEREKQQAAWQRGVDAAGRDLPARRTALADAEARRSALTDELAGIDEDRKGADKKARKDLSARQGKVSDELKRAEKEIARLQGEITGLEQKAAEPFEFRPPPTTPGRPAQTGGRFVPSASSKRPVSHVPDEALPEVGALRSHKGQRYLVIQSWDQLAAGERAAARLSARLVAPEKA